MSKCFCYKCNNELLDYEAERRIPREEECPHCFASLHCCLMCQFHDKSSYNECKEPIAQRILDKDKANFCDLFKLKSGKNTIAVADDLFAQANSLFKN